MKLKDFNFRIYDENATINLWVDHKYNLFETLCGEFEPDSS
ncbi:hypothetical protein LOS1_00085 [Campylobacter phage vB_CjeM_Los1]|uniref:Uncharacterized protein n=1 Tax=Campylobacter phage vB_CjeM_Los1 TaxID=1904491 RepID=A0A1D8EXF7_9CAUD|nr:hypothetical protein FDH13_gp085 [Campylobacter phage vB_CjeM_Los1]AOT25906.1 hypothetical protein LOS1_00085 [Campylobacter phage vB_CjeM_Los1]